MASAKPLNVQQMSELFEEEDRPANDVIRAALEDIQGDCRGRGFELQEVSSGFRFQVIQDVAQWVSRLWDEKPQKYSRALLETLSLIAYRQPITRGDIEDIRGVAVSSNIVRTLLEREWVRVVGHKDVPGRPAMYATTRRFLDYFNLANLDDLPSLAEIRDLDSMNEELALEGADTLPIPRSLELEDDDLDDPVETLPSDEDKEVEAEAAEPGENLAPAGEEDVTVDAEAEQVDDVESDAQLSTEAEAEVDTEIEVEVETEQQEAEASDESDVPA